MQKLFFLCCITAFFAACTPNKSSYSHLFKKWEGSWAIKAAGILTEEWKKENDTLWSGKSYMQKNDSTIPLETMQIRIKGDSIFYMPTVPNQNQGKTISFYLSQKNDSLFVFENPKHDFPQRIIYAFSENKKLLVTIDGKINGSYRKEDFSFTKNE